MPPREQVQPKQLQKGRARPQLPQPNHRTPPKEHRQRVIPPPTPRETDKPRPDPPNRNFSLDADKGLDERLHTTCCLLSVPSIVLISSNVFFLHSFGYAISKEKYLQMRKQSASSRDLQLQTIGLDKMLEVSLRPEYQYKSVTFP